MKPRIPTWLPARVATSANAKLRRTLAYSLVPLEEREDFGKAMDLAWRTLVELAAGRPYQPVLPDGREGEPRTPSPEVRLKAARELLSRGFGAAPTFADKQLQQQTLDANTVNVEALTDDELVQQVKGALQLVEGRDDTSGDNG